MHSCYLCTGYKVDAEDNKTNKRGRWVKGSQRSLNENQRCYDNWLRDTSDLSKKEARAKLMDYCNVHHPPFRVNSDGDRAIFWYMPFDPLHCVKLGAMLDVINALEKEHPRVIGKFLSDLSLSRARGGMPGLNLNG